MFRYGNLLHLQWCFFLAISGCASAQNRIDDTILDQAARFRDLALHNSEAYEVLSSLVTEVGPRFAGTDGEAAAVDWAQHTLRMVGLKNVRAEKVEIRRWERGDVAVRIISPYPRALVAVALGWSVATPAEGIVAPVLRAADIEELQAMPRSEVLGKIVFFDKRMQRLRDGSGYRKTVGIRADGPAIAASLGAVAVVIRSVGTSDDRIAHTGMTHYREDAPRIPAVALSNPDAELLQRQLGSGQPVKLSIFLSARELPPGDSANVIGEIPGVGKNSHQIVLLAAHLDSWDITPGANDDAAGIAIVTDVARLLVACDSPPPRTIRVVLAASEETFLSGARTYAVAHIDELEDHVIAIEADAGAGRVWGIRSGVADDGLTAVAQIHGLLEPLDIQYMGNHGLGGADLRPIRERGVPTMDLLHDMRAYFDVHHTINDTLAKIDPKQLRQAVASYAALTYAAVYGDIDFGRHPEAAREDQQELHSAGGSGAAVVPADEP